MKKTYKLLCFRGCIALSVLFLTTSSITEYNRKEYPDNDPQKELESFQIADGFEVTLFASEPMVVKPIQMNWDAEGRLWVISSTAYPHLKTGEQANDKVFVLEDTDGDGVADKSTVFAEGLLTPTGILPGDGGVYVANSTEILFLADTDGDGKADVRRKVLSGFGTADTHHLIHTFRWGPEGRLYFNQSIYIHSHVETPWGIRRLEGGGVWKLNPQTLELDVYAHGLINPWGLRFDR
ncbi:MAG: PVC-type heme-binding CxxCH protein, partial [Spirosomataceae bacterium]